LPLDGRLMGRPRKVPAVLVEATIRRNAKLAALPSDTARLGFFYVVLGDAKLSEPVPGQFASREVFREVAGRWARYLDDYVKVGVLEIAPRLCDRCKAAWSSMPPRSGAVVVHDWHQHQYDPRKVERQREYEDRQRASGAAVSDGVSDGVSDAQSDAEPGVSDAVSDGVSDAIPTVSSRAGARDRARRTLNVERRENESGSPDVEYRADAQGTRKVNGFATVGDVAAKLAAQSDDWTQALTLAERDEWARFGPEWDAFRVAWLARGFRHPPAGSADDDPDDPSPSQRALLHSILDAWPSELPRWITEAPKRLAAAGVVALVIERWHGKRDEGTERAAAQENARTTRDFFAGVETEAHP
jgi:hypothetical protein